MHLLEIGSHCPPQQFLPAAHQLLMQMKGKKSENGTSFLLHRHGPCKGREELSPRRTTQVPVGPTPHQPQGSEVSQQSGDVYGRGENRRVVGGSWWLPPSRAAPHLQEAPAGGRGPAPAPCRPASSRCFLICDSGSPAAGRTQEGRDHPSVRAGFLYQPQWGSPGENGMDLKKKKILTVFLAISISVVSNHYLEVKSLPQLALICTT